MRLDSEPDSWGEYWDIPGLSIRLIDPTKKFMNEHEELLAMALDSKGVSWYYEPEITLEDNPILVDRNGHEHKKFCPDYVFSQPWMYYENGKRYIIHGFELKGRKVNKFTRRKKQILAAKGIIIVIVHTRVLRIWMKNGGIPIKPIRKPKKIIR